MKKRSMFVGMDVHKESIDISVAEDGRGGEVRHYGVIAGDLEALRGVSFVTAVGLVAEVGDFRRFTHPRHLMAYLGLVPSEHSSGPSVRRGAITKAGNPHARRLLAEAAWAYHGIPRVSRRMLARQETVPKPIRDIAWKAQLRLTGRFRRLVARGKAKPKVATAIARELTGFMWAIAQEVPSPSA
jgi:transposase